MSARKSSRSRFTVPQLLHWTRRTSNSRYTRRSPQDRSRTRRVRRSYQPLCTRPQQPHAVFLSAAQDRQRKPSGHRRSPGLWELAESRESGRCPTGVGVCASGHHARFPDPVECGIHAPIPPKMSFHALRLPTHQGEEPTKEKGNGGFRLGQLDYHFTMATTDRTSPYRQPLPCT